MICCFSLKTTFTSSASKRPPITRVLAKTFSASFSVSPWAARSSRPRDSTSRLIVHARLVLHVFDDPLQQPVEIGQRAAGPTRPPSRLSTARGPSAAPTTRRRSSCRYRASRTATSRSRRTTDRLARFSSMKGWKSLNRKIAGSIWSSTASRAAERIGRAARTRPCCAAARLHTSPGLASASTDRISSFAVRRSRPDIARPALPPSSPDR